jgi:transposase
MSSTQRETLEVLVRAQAAPHRQVQRARVLLLAAEGVANTAIAAEVGVTPVTVRSWRHRFGQVGLAKLGEVRRGRGPKASISTETVEAIVQATLYSRPKGHTHWSTRTLAAEFGVSPATVHKIWKARGLKPHLVDSFKLSTDPGFEEKLTDVVGLYLNPPEQAVVLCMDEKSQVQALDRTQPWLPMKKGRAGTMTHDYKRNGTTTLFAAMDVLTGAVIGQCLPRHRHEEFLKFLKTIDAEVPDGLAVHLILDNYSTHKHQDVQRWLRRHKRFHLHFTPTSSSWLNLVERWFRELTDKALRRGSFNSVPDLIASIQDYLEAHNDDPKPFIWTATVDSILEKVRRGRVTLNQVANQ